MKFFYYLNLFSKKQKRGIISLFSLMLISTLLEMLSLGLIFPLTGIIINDAGTLNNQLITNLLIFFNVSKENIIFLFAVLFIGCYIIKISVLTYYHWFESKFVFSFKQLISYRLFSNYLSQSYSFFFNRNSSEFLRNITSEVDHLITYILYTLKLYLEIIIIIGILLILFYINFFVSFLAIIYFSIIAFCYFFILKKKIYSWGQQRIYHANKFIQYLQESFENIKIIKILNRESLFLNRFQKHNYSQSKLLRNVNFLQNLPRLIFELFFILGIFSLITALLSKNISVNELIKFLTVMVAASFRLLPSINKIITSLQLTKLNFPSIKLLENELKLTRLEKRDNNFKENFKFEKKIKINISKFQISQKSKFSLKEINFEINAKDKIGIVGPSGSGKSTLIDLIAGFYDSSNEMIKVDDLPISKNIKGWQSLIGYVPQKITIIDDTLKNNLLFGLDVEYDDDNIIKLLKKLNLEKLLNRLPDGIHSTIHEKGINLSGGELQRIGICRALIFKPKLLILDEITSALDDSNAKDIFNLLEKLDVTLISISHNESLFKNFSKILRMKDGKIIN